MKLQYIFTYTFLLFLSSCAYDTIEPEMPDIDQLAFSKANGADPTLAENQDRITDNVWITRGNSGGQIYNSKVSQSANKDNSPVDTEWALGSKEEKDALTFDSFRQTVKPQQVVGKDLVLHLITDDIYLNIRFTSWSSGKGGGFSYVRDRIPEE